MKIDEADFQEIKELLQILPRREDVEQVQKHLNESLEEFKNDNKQFHLDFQKQNEIIRRYDEIISSKASKIDIKTIKETGTKNLQEEKQNLIKNIKSIKIELFKQIEDVNNVLKNLN